MRSSKMNGYIGKFDSSFLSCEKDIEKIISKLFVESKPHSEELKRLLVINNKDCLDNRTNPAYLEELAKYKNPAKLHEDGYVRFVPKLEFGENEKVKSYLLITFDNFTPNDENPYYRDGVIMIDVMCLPETWELGNYRLRPLKIAGYVDGILNGSKLSGIGTLQFMGANEITLGQDLIGYCLIYRTVHGVDDALPVND